MRHRPFRRPAHRDVPGLAPRFRRALLRGAALTAGAGLVVVGGTGAAFNDPGPSRDLDVEVALTSPLGKLMDRYECTTLGFDDGSTPRSTIVRRVGGQLDVVSFDEGWDTFTADGPDELVAVCLRPAG